MGAKGGYAPDGAKGRIARTVFLRAPFRDWSALSQGHKIEFRSGPRGAISIYAPTPVVLYCLSPRQKRRKEKLMVLVDHRSERLMDIADNRDSLRAEGFETYEQFRSYWRQRTSRLYIPMARVEVWRLGLWNDRWTSYLGQQLIERLYGDWLSPARSAA